jgi:hypothetical protein
MFFPFFLCTSKSETRPISPEQGQLNYRIFCHTHQIAVQLLGRTRSSQEGMREGNEECRNRKKTRKEEEEEFYDPEEATVCRIWHPPKNFPRNGHQEANGRRLIRAVTRSEHLARNAGGLAARSRSLRRDLSSGDGADRRRRREREIRTVPYAAGARWTGSGWCRLMREREKRSRTQNSTARPHGCYKDYTAMRTNFFCFRLL